MEFSEYLDNLSNEGKIYRNGTLANEIVPQLKGQPLNDAVVKQIMTPFIEAVKGKLSNDDKVKFIELAEYLLPGLVTQMHLDVHMHKAGKATTVSQDSADALLTVFINRSCVPVDLGFYSKDLES